MEKMLNIRKLLKQGKVRGVRHLPIFINATGDFLSEQRYGCLGEHPLGEFTIDSWR
ncbi:hypothetical protein [Listeria monocytogenes]|uniref:hypothetical protein n=1 Tax=Listeria monocytogenes TaxID=1639 RepID=UPI000B2DA893|nr:hypothetical protein [Listeria monocytogenes]EGB1113282.1 hypothetical protein [Listeria monocytogenes]EGI8086979.1 hypothetical protein [Listeria monocytogenes]EHG0871695.1 hypothetical protein [Listeria monocytogenes]EHK9356322.1 hypothetical protein [Listeria monocytogenes]EHS5048181.1 hypothetical protein [Listeria monocytogenes]